MIILRGFRKLTLEILFHNQAADRYTIGSTPAAILYIYRYGNLRIVHRCKTHKHRVVMTAVLGRTRLTTGHKVVSVEFMTRTTHHRRSHTLHHIVVSLTRGLCIVTTCKRGVERFALHLPHHMRHIVVAPVGNRGSQVGNLKRCGIHLTLSDGDRDDRQTIP